MLQLVPFALAVLASFNCQALNADRDSDVVRGEAPQTEIRTEGNNDHSNGLRPAISGVCNLSITGTSSDSNRTSSSCLASIVKSGKNRVQLLTAAHCTPAGVNLFWKEVLNKRTTHFAKFTMYARCKVGDGFRSFQLDGKKCSVHKLYVASKADFIIGYHDKSGKLQKAVDLATCQLDTRGENVDALEIANSLSKGSTITWIG